MEHSQSSATGHPRNINVQFYLRTLFLMLYSWKNIYYLNFGSHAKRHTKIFRCFNTSQMFDFLLNSTPIRTCRVKFILWLQYDYCSTSNEFCGFHQLVEDKYCLDLMQKTVKEIQQGHIFIYFHTKLWYQNVHYLFTRKAFHLFPLTVAICDESTAREGFQFSTPIDSNFFCC